MTADARSTGPNPGIAPSPGARVVHDAAEFSCPYELAWSRTNDPHAIPRDAATGRVRDYPRVHNALGDGRFSCRPHPDQPL